MKQPFTAFFALSFAVSGTNCSTPKSSPQTKPHHPPLGGITDIASGTAIVPETSKTGHFGKGLLADYDDRDGDGIFEEARRTDTTYFDRNGDRLADLVVRGEQPFLTIEWDADYNGRLDHSATSEEGYVHRLVINDPISKPAPNLFLEDRIQKTSPRPLSSPGWHFWESLLQLK